MRTPAPSDERANSEEYRREECARLYLSYVSWCRDIVENYRGSDSETARLACEYIDDATSRLAKMAGLRQKDVLVARYIDRKIVPEIAAEYELSQHTIHKDCMYGLRELWKFLPEEWKNVYKKR